MATYFEKQLTEVDVKKQVAIPTSFVQHLPDHDGGYTMSLPVCDVSGKVWEFGYYRRTRDGYAKPVFQKGWRDFVRGKGLSPGDKIIFRVERNGVDGAPMYTVAAQKRIRLFGSAVGWTEMF
ncbi:hypothetical protein HRI_004198700 [Hibiscus trionum]|uniref:TF-B3 domain-containing protein n=1 Tax=Hibiscus trionum TaxID=183268 RepID=A0A9W7J0K8_HIBTR|nr:hypothetical protein HRI_004198700 [Hibiscus trionum]